MAKSLKRAGIVFFAIFISCLLLFAVLMSSQVAEKLVSGDDLNTIDTQLTADNNYFISGTNAQISQIWNNAVAESKKKETAVKVTLAQDWIADSNHSMGTGDGFSNGTIAVLDGVNIILDLNGHNIDRKLTATISSGHVISVKDSTLTIIDRTNTGKITGANTSGIGGAIQAYSAVINMYGGSLSDNVSTHGGGISAYNDTVVNMYGGKITNNQSHYAGAIMLDIESIFNMYDGELSNNKITSFGGAVYVYSNCVMTMYGGVIKNNTGANIGGGIRCYNGATFVMNGGEICDNKAGAGSGIDIVKNCTLELNCGKIYNNISTGSYSGVTTSVERPNPDPGEIIIGKDIHIFNNTNGSNAQSNLVLSNDVDKVTVKEKLKSANVGITLNNTSRVFAQGYTSSGNTLSPDIFFHSDKSGYIASKSGDAVAMVSGTTPTTQVKWTVANTTTLESNNYLEVTYNAKPYKVSNNIGTFSAANGTQYTYYQATDAGVYEFFMVGNYVNPTFTLVIKPYEVDVVWSNNTGFTYNGQEQYPTATCKGLDNSVINVTVEGEINAGKHYAKAVSVDNSNYKLKPTAEIFKYYTISPKVIDNPVLEQTSYVYGATVYIIREIKGYNSDTMVMGGTETASDVGNYTTTITPKSNYIWGNGNDDAHSYTWKITPKLLEKPVQSDNYTFVYSGSSITFIPSKFNSDQMKISNNSQTEIGKYVATVSPISSNYKWNDNTSSPVEYKFEIIHPGVVAKDGTSYEYIYNENNIRKSYVSGKFIHKVNDSSIATIDGTIRYVMGGISTNTKLSVFLNNLRNDLNLIKVYDKNSHIIYDGIASNGIIPESVTNILVGTGFKVELYENTTSSTAFDTVYLSVLGDVNGDGRITASDIAYLREIAKDNSILNSIDVEYRLAAMVNNKGGVTNIDSEILYNVMASEIELNIFFKSGVNTDSSYKYLTLNKENGKYERVVSETATNVIGNVAVNTKVSEFKANLAILGVNTAGITIYKNEQVLDDNAIVGTGCYFEIAGVKTYISVLGDLNGDGRISASDIMYLNEIKAEDYTEIEDHIILSAIILNTGKITSADVEVLRDNIENFTALSNY